MGFDVKVGNGLRRCGVADAALGGELAEIADGGGKVEGYPEETDDRTLSGSFLLICSSPDRGLVTRARRGRSQLATTTRA